jgi:hypothetical protein
VQVSNNKELPKWLNNFVDAFEDGDNETKVAKGDNREDNNIEDKNNQDSQQEKYSEVNIDDLDEVVWKDETFYVMFDGDVATILNKFGNTVTTLQGTSTIEEVNEELNGKEVVTSKENNPFEEEIEKVSPYREEIEGFDEQQPNNNNNNQMTNQQPNNNNNNQQQQPNNNNNNQQPNNNNNNQQPTGFDGQPVQQAEKIIAKQNEKFEKQSEKIKQKDKEIKKLNEKVANLQNDLSDLKKTIEALIPQDYARNNPGNIFDIDSGQFDKQRKEEGEEVEKTLRDIEQEVDLTTPEGRADFVDKVDKDVRKKDTEKEDYNDYKDIEDAEINFNDIDLEDDNSRTLQENDDVDNEVDIDIDSLDEGEEVVLDKTANKKMQIERLSNKKKIKLFNNNICPNCDSEEETLTKHNSTGNFEGKYCEGCGSEFAINTKTNEVYCKQ